jgi:uncharacterized Fe-S cluster protein YjdI
MMSFIANTTAMQCRNSHGCVVGEGGLVQLTRKPLQLLRRNAIDVGKVMDHLARSF